MKDENIALSKGFTALELLIVLAIIGIILAIMMYSYNTLKSKKQIEVTIDALDFKLEEAKTNALGGKNGTNFGINFSTTTYTYFSGTSYNPANTANSTTTILSNLRLTTSFSDGGKVIIFSRLTGAPQATGTITLSDTTSSNTAQITIGALGNINVIK